MLWPQWWMLTQECSQERLRLTPVSAMKDMAATIPGSDYRELDTGHLAPLEQPAAFAALLRAFANRVYAA